MLVALWARLTDELAHLPARLAVTLRGSADPAAMRQQIGNSLIGLFELADAMERRAAEIGAAGVEWRSEAFPDG